MMIDRIVIFLLLALESQRARLRASVRVTESGCWLWDRKSTDGRYGHFYMFGVRFKAHVASYILFKGRIPRGHVVRHGCDQTLCCAPDCLTTGTQAQNRADASERGRWAHGITKRTVARIRNLITRKHNDSEVARRVGVHQSTVGRIRKGEIR